MSDTCKKYKYFVTGGGTGGHIYPAIAVANRLRQLEDTQEVFYVGNPHNLEYEVVNNEGFKFLPIKVSAMPRKISLGFIKWAIELELANWKALYYIFKYKPDAIIGTGGYVSAPALFAASFARVPFMIHDSDAQPGIVSKYVAPLAKSVSLAFEDSAAFLKSNNIHVNGNPIRDSFKTLTKEEARNILGLKNKTTLCIMGGSSGARSINLASIEILKLLIEKYDLQIIFQTGKKNYEICKNRMDEIFSEYENCENLIMQPYFEKLDIVLKASDIAISRAGSLSLSEICACGIAPILIPYPYASADHQRKNAKSLLKRECCMYLEDSDTNPQTLQSMIEELLNNPHKLEQLQKNSFSLARLDATNSIVNQLKEIIKK